MVASRVGLLITILLCLINIFNVKVSLQHFSCPGSDSSFPLGSDLHHVCLQCCNGLHCYPQQEQHHLHQYQVIWLCLFSCESCSMCCLLVHYEFKVVICGLASGTSPTSQVEQTQALKCLQILQGISEKMVQ